MDDFNAKLYPDTRIDSLLAFKPISMEWLAARGIDPFHRPDATLDQIRRRLGMDWEDMLEALGSLGAPEGDSDWGSLPLSRLLEFLTREHREFRQVFIPAIKSAFAAGEGKPDFMGPLLPLVNAWPGFSASLLEHIGSEEALLFPKILRDQYRSRYGEADMAALFDPSLAYPSLLFLRKEGEHLEKLRRYLDAASYCGSPESMEKPAISVYRMLHFLHARLAEHSRLEREFLLPRAAMLEKDLRDRTHAGLLLSNACPTQKTP
jgi:iron-sulfur cluster repair protein YtfE (RIC family)